MEGLSEEYEILKIFLHEACETVKIMSTLR